MVRIHSAQPHFLNNILMNVLEIGHFFYL